jgi:fumarylacetoacetase
VPQADVEYAVPARIGDYTDFYTSIHHALNIGRLFRPDDPCTPNFQWIPIAYHGRVSTHRRQRPALHRPDGPDDGAGRRARRSARARGSTTSSSSGMFIGRATRRRAIALGRADDHIFGICLLNDWSARDIQFWEMAPLGPVPGEELRDHDLAVDRDDGGAGALPPPGPAGRRSAAAALPRGAAIARRARSTSARSLARDASATCRRQRADALSQTSFRHQYWTVAQMVAHHTVGGCSLNPGDLFGSGTISGPGPGEAGAMIELTRGGQAPMALADGDTRAFLQDGDAVMLRGWCEKPGAARIGFGESRGWCCRRWAGARPDAAPCPDWRIVVYFPAAPAQRNDFGMAFPLVCFFMLPVTHLRRCAWLLALAISAAAGAAPAQEAPPTGATLRVWNRTVFVFRVPMFGLSPQQRADRAAERIADIPAANLGAPVEVAGFTHEGVAGYAVMHEGATLFAVFASDLEPGDPALPKVAELAASRLHDALLARQSQGSGRQFALSLGSAALATLALVAVLIGLQHLARGARARSLGLRTRSAARPLFDPRRIAVSTLGHVIQGFKFALALMAIYVWLAYVLTRFPYTHPWGETLDKSLIAVASRVAIAVLHAMPDLAMVAVIFLLAHFMVRGLHSLFNAAHASGVKVAALQSDTIGATRRLTGVLVWLFAAVVAYPFIPGSDSGRVQGAQRLLRGAGHARVVRPGVAGHVGLRADLLARAAPRRLRADRRIGGLRGRARHALDQAAQPPRPGGDTAQFGGGRDPDPEFERHHQGPARQHRLVDLGHDRLRQPVAPGARHARDGRHPHARPVERAATGGASGAASGLLPRVRAECLHARGRTQVRRAQRAARPHPGCLQRVWRAESCRRISCCSRPRRCWWPRSTGGRRRRSEPPGSVARRQPEQAGRLQSSTGSSRWLKSRQRQRRMPRCGRFSERRASITSASKPQAVAGPHRVRPLEQASPGEAKDSEPASAASVTSRIAIALVCQPLAIRPPKGPSAAASASVWNHCGS